MKLASTRTYPLSLPFRQPLYTARGTIKRRRTLLVRLDDDRGNVGWGEAAPLPGFTEESPGDVALALGVLLSMLEGERIPERPSGLCSFIAELAMATHDGIPPTASVAVETALLDLVGQRSGQPLAALLEPNHRPVVPISRLVFDAQAATLALASGIRSLKIKVGGPDPEAELRRVAEVRAAVGPEVELRIDANRGWSFTRAEQLLPRYAALGVALVEEPLLGSTPSALAALRRCGVRIAVDESVQCPADLEEVTRAESVDALVLKPAFVGSLVVARDMARFAAGAGLAVIVTSALESAVGRRMALHVAAGVPAGALRACGLDTGGLLRADVGADPPVEDGAMAIGQAPGLGLTPVLP